MRGSGPVVVTAAIVAACGGDATEPAGPAVVRSDSAGVAIVHTRRPVWDEGGGWTVDPEPELVIGRLEGDEPYLFGEVRGAVRLDDGSIVVVDNQAREVRWFDSAGTFVRARGGPGGGPTEFSHSAYGLERCGPDRLYVHDLWARRILSWDTAGAFLRGFDLVEPGDPTRGPYNHTCRDDGGFVAVGWGHRNASDLPLLDGREAVTYSQFSPLWELDASGELEVEHGSFLSSERIRHRNGTGPHPFGRAVDFAAGGGRVFIGTGEGLAVDVYREGELRERWRADTDDLTLDGDFRTAYEGADTADVDERYRDWVLDEVVSMPPELPASTELRVTPDGHLWAKRFTVPWRQTNRWGIFAPDGVFLGNLELPGGFRVTEVGDDYALGVVTDELGVERVHLHRLHRARR